MRTWKGIAYATSREKQQLVDISLLGATQHESPQNTLPFVCRFHPAFRRAFSRALRLVPPPSEMNVSLRASWKNALPSVNSLVEAHNRKMCSRVVGRGGRSVRFFNTSHKYKYQYMRDKDVYIYTRIRSLFTGSNAKRRLLGWCITSWSWSKIQPGLLLDCRKLWELHRICSH